MNHNRLYSYRIMAVMVIVFVTACTQSKKGESETQEAPPTTTADGTQTEAPEDSSMYTATPAFKQQLTQVFNQYVDLKNAFVASDVEKAREEVEQVRVALAQVDAKVLMGEAGMNWAEYVDGMETALMEIEGTQDIEVQRGAFSMLSNNLYTCVKSFGLDGETAYYQFCPMAFNGEGAYWLSDKEEIRNPYFGDKMLTCGKVKETI